MNSHAHRTAKHMWTVSELLLLRLLSYSAAFFSCGVLFSQNSMHLPTKRLRKKQNTMRMRVKERTSFRMSYKLIVLAWLLVDWSVDWMLSSIEMFQVCYVTHFIRFQSKQEMNKKDWRRAGRVSVSNITKIAIEIKRLVWFMHTAPTINLILTIWIHKYILLHSTIGTIKKPTSKKEWNISHTGTKREREDDDDDEEEEGEEWKKRQPFIGLYILDRKNHNRFLCTCVVYQVMDWNAMPLCVSVSIFLFYSRVCVCLFWKYNIQPLENTTYSSYSKMMEEKYSVCYRYRVPPHIIPYIWYDSWINTQTLTHAPHRNRYHWEETQRATAQERRR